MSFWSLTPVFYAGEAGNLTPSCRLAGQDPNGVRYLLFDGSTKTGINVKNAMTVSFEASKPIRSLYLVWDTPHDRWDMVSLKNGEEIRKAYGENGFLHEYVDLEEDHDRITLEFYGADAILCDIYAFSAGDVPEWVQIWQPPLEKADLLVFPARAGDEFLYFGGTIPYYVEKGKSVQVAYMTNLFNEPLKTHALLNALYLSGIRTYPVISGFPEIAAADLEGVLERYDENGFLAFAVELLRRFKPEVVVGPGYYDDGVQMLSAATLMVALEPSGNELDYRESAEKYGVWDVPKVYLHGYGEDMVEMDWGDSLELARQCFLQYQWRQDRSVAIDGVCDCRGFGLFRTAVGPDVKKNDFFENIIESDGLTDMNGPETDPEPAPPPSLPEPQPSEESGPVPLSEPPAVMLLIAFFMIAAAVLLRMKKD